MELGVYIHFPWCRRRCPYCDFAIAVAPEDEIPHDRYADAVIAELRARAPLFRPGRALRSIYFGGGTPALWRAAAVARVRAAVLDELGPAAGPFEVTVEANPNDCTPAVLDGLLAAGATRLSVGAQAFEADELVLLGRDHDGRQALAAVAAARRAGFGQVSLDLIYALPGRTLADWERTLVRAIELAPDHLSVYQLTIEPRTSFGQAARTGRLVPVDDDTAAAAFLLAHERLVAAGWEHYEVSSYARPGARARHNSLYWQGAEYLGLGNGAHSFWRPAPERGVRWSAHRSVVRYLAAAPGAPGTGPAGDPLVAEVTEQDEAALRSDGVWLGLRTTDGIPAELIGAHPALGRLHAAGLIVAEEGRIRPTPRGLLFADEVGASLLE